MEPEILLSAVRDALQATGISPGLVKLEITESSNFMETMKGTLQDLREMGCRVALDDFGTGFSSLTQLNELPLDYLKLDRSFIKELDSADLAARRRSLRMTQAALSLAEAFDLIPIVEGVETLSQLKAVTTLGAELIQGYYFSKPMPSEKVVDYINRRVDQNHE